MKRDEVPQERNATATGLRKAAYALDEGGRYTTVTTSGWSVEETVTGDAVAEYRRLAREAWEAARRGQAAPLKFHMYNRRMDEPMLAQTVGIWSWRLRHHLRPGTKLSEEWMARYAEALGVPAEELRKLPDHPPPPESAA